MKPPVDNNIPANEAKAGESSEPESAPAVKPGTALVVANQDMNGNKDRPQDSLLRRILARLGLRSTGTLRDDLEDALSGQSGGEAEIFSPAERTMINDILRLREVRVEDVMVPRADISAVDLDTTLDDLLQEFEDSGHSRLPVFSDTMDDPRGMVLIKDLLIYFSHAASHGRKKNGVKGGRSRTGHLLSKINLSKTLGSVKLVRTVLFVPPSMLVMDLMTRMQTARTQMALVIDEYGGTDGLVTLEDIVEEVFGEIEDEHDDDIGPTIENTGEGIFTADARVDLDDAVELLGPTFDYQDLGEDMDTIGGLVFSLAGRIPVRGEVIHGMPGFEFRILDADPRRIKSLQIVKRRLPVRSQRPRKQAADDAE